MRLILIFFLSISFNVAANQKLSGQWEGFVFGGGTHNSHILEIDKNGEGFYALSLSGSLDFISPSHIAQ